MCHFLLCHCLCQSNHTKEFDSQVKTYFCPDGKYNDMATLLFNSQEDAIKQLFHQDGKFSVFSATIVEIQFEIPLIIKLYNYRIFVVFSP